MVDAVTAAQPVPAQVQTLNGHLANWLRRNGYPIRDFQVVARGEQPEMNPAFGGYAGVALPGTVSFGGPSGMRDVTAAAARYGKRGKTTASQQAGIELMMHEALHQMRYGRTPQVNEGDGAYWEEAATESAARDALPALMAQLYGDRVSTISLRSRNAAHDEAGAYAENVKRLQQLSTFATGAGNYTTRPARVWRRSFLHADAATRQAMLDAANQKRVEWGARSGR